MEGLKSVTGLYGWMLAKSLSEAGRVPESRGLYERSRRVSFVRELRKSGTEPVKLLRLSERFSMLVKVLKNEGSDSVKLLEVSLRLTRFVRELKVSGMEPVYLLPRRARMDSEEREPKNAGMELAVVVVPPRLRYTRLAREVNPEGIELSTLIR
jgi:hypothetical protein